MQDAGGLFWEIIKFTLTSLGDVWCNGVWDELGNNILQVSTADLPLDDVHHLLPDVLDLGALGIAGLLGGPVKLGGESDAEESKHVSVSGLDINVALDQGLPLLDHGPELVGGEVHAVEAGEAVLALDLLDEKLELSVGSLGILLSLEISKRTLEDTSLQTLRGNLGSLCPVKE